MFRTPSSYKICIVEATKTTWFPLFTIVCTCIWVCFWVFWFVSLYKHFITAIICLTACLSVQPYKDFKYYILISPIVCACAHVCACARVSACALVYAALM